MFSCCFNLQPHSAVDHPHLEELLENPPDWFHELRVKGFVVILEI
jgi:hypothetical protein